jgi:hypothetical protein
VTAARRSPEAASALPVGDPRRPAMGRALGSALLTAAVFSAATGPVKQIPVLYDHAPWVNDPFDTVVSFAMFFVPLLAVYCLARVPLCRRSEPLPRSRATDLMRGCRLMLAVAAATLLTEWVSVAAGANRSQWNGATWLQVGLLAAMTVLTVRAIVELYRVPALSRPARADAQPTVDWLTDIVAVAALLSNWLGPLHRPALVAVSWADRRLVTVVRRHPLWAAAIAAALFGVGVGGLQSINEGYIALAALLTISLLSCGMFAFLVAAGSYVGLVRSNRALVGRRRQVLDAATATCLGLLVVLAFRNSLWWLVSSNAVAAGISQTYALLGLAALAIFATVFALATLRQHHVRAQ